MTSARLIADAARVTEHPDGARTIRWRDGMSRTYSRVEIAGMFLEALEKGHTNPLLERLTTPDERAFLYRQAEHMSNEMAEAVARGDTRLKSLSDA